MSLGSGPMSAKRWRPVEQVGWAVGIVAGSLVLLCIWIFALTQPLIALALPVRVPSKTTTGGIPWTVPTGR